MILEFSEEIMHPVPQGAVSFDFDGTLTRWTPDLHGFHEEPYIPALTRLLFWHRMGRKIYIVTHRTKELEGNKAFLGHGKDKMKIAEFIERCRVPVSMNDVIFTKFGDKGEALNRIGAVLHYDDEDDNLNSASNAGVIAVRVNTGFKISKDYIDGDGHGKVDRKTAKAEALREREEVSFDG
jgi:FMN phosphatase YigB (HAD superfamily)